jgi:hypothetical protein
MHDVALARRERGDYGKRNMRQLPVFDTPPTGFNVGGPSFQGSENTLTATSQISIPSYVSAQGYEQARNRFDFDLLSLSALTSVHFNRAAVKAISMAPDRLVPILELRERSYMDYAVQYYESSSVLRDVIDCTMAQAKRVISPNGSISEATVLSLYVKALRGLQAALNDSETWRLPEVLCAAQVLSLFEVSNLRDLLSLNPNLSLVFRLFITSKMAPPHSWSGEANQTKRYPRLWDRLREVPFHISHRMYSTS